jgi:hypothetical protein
MIWTYYSSLILSYGAELTEVCRKGLVTGGAGFTFNLAGEVIPTPNTKSPSHGRGITALASLKALLPSRPHLLGPLLTPQVVLSALFPRPYQVSPRFFFTRDRNVRQGHPSRLHFRSRFWFDFFLERGREQERFGAGQNAETNSSFPMGCGARAGRSNPNAEDEIPRRSQRCAVTSQRCAKVRRHFADLNCDDLDLLFFVDSFLRRGINGSLLSAGRISLQGGAGVTFNLTGEVIPTPNTKSPSHGRRFTCARFA